MIKVLKFGGTCLQNQEYIDSAIALLDDSMARLKEK